MERHQVIPGTGQLAEIETEVRSRAVSEPAGEPSELKWVPPTKVEWEEWKKTHRGEIRYMGQE